MASSPLPRRHSEMPKRSTPTRRISTLTDTPSGNSNGDPNREPRRGSAPMSASMTAGISAGGGTSNTLDQRRARREQLRNFYGIKEEKGAEGDAVNGTGTGSREGAKGDPLDIDSPSSNPSMYYEHLISKENLRGLMKKASSLQADIGNLEGSRHSLVYNHHHQLFAAGDTISHLNSRTPQLLSIMTELQSSFSSISGLVDSISLPENTSLEDKEGDGVHEDEPAGRAVRRLGLMLAAEESPEKIKAMFEGVREALQARAEDDPEIKDLLAKVHAIILEPSTAENPQ